MLLMQIALGCFLLVGVVGWIFLWCARTAEQKRRVYARFTIATGILFFVFVCSTVGAGGPWSAVAFAGPAIVLVTCFSLFAIDFCDRCHRILFPRTGWRRTGCCPHCGYELVKDV